MRYEVGDSIRIREDLEERGEDGMYEHGVGFDYGMAKYAGKLVTIKEVYPRYYKLEEDDGYYYWSDDMIDPNFGEMFIPKEEKNMVHEAVERIDREQILREMYDTLDICEIYHPTDNGMNILLNEWAEKKGRSDVWNGNSTLDILSKHPDYVPEKGYIVKKNEYDRGVDLKVITSVLGEIEYAVTHPTSFILSPVEIRPWSYAEVNAIVEKLNGILVAMGVSDDIRYRGMNYREVAKERDIWDSRKVILESTYTVSNGECYLTSDMENMRYLGDLMSEIKKWASNTISGMTEDELLQPLLIDDEVTQMIEDSGLYIRGIRTGQKFNKVIIKILTETGVKDKWSQFNKQTARLSDATSPTKFTRFTIVSANPVDYWRMSFGSSWKSCHTIDKEGYYSPSDGGDGYEGMHASGTESYMLDESSVVMYTVDKEYEGSDYELQPKINRCMFHIGEGKFVMGRVYPQGTDGEEEVYKQWRNIFQQIIAECMDQPNYWKTLKSRSEKLEQIRSDGTHYRDYEYGYCDIAGWSYIKPTAETTPTTKYIKIGAQPICPCCGTKHWEDDTIECESCRTDGEIECRHCGTSHSREDMYEIDGEYYCSECVFYCEYHEEYEPIGRYEDNCYYVNGYGNVCENAIEHSDNFCRDDWNDEYYYVPDCEGIDTEDGNWYHSIDTAVDAGYVECNDGYWRKESEVYYCAECERYFTDDEWDDEHDMCKECAEELADDDTETAIA